MTASSHPSSALGDHPVEILASADGEPVALHDLGGDGRTLLLGHGNGLNAGMWAAALPHLRRHGFHCYGVDLRGHGACRPVDPHYSVARARFADDVLACVDALGGGPLAYAGHSLGGAAGLLACLRRPAAFAALWVFEPVLVPDGFVRLGGAGPSFLVEASRRRRMLFDSVDDAVDRLGTKPPFASCDPVAVRGYLEVGTRPVPGGVSLTCRGEDEARVFEGGDTTDFALLADLAVPVTVVCGASGDEAHAIPAALAPRVAAALGRGRLERHPTLSHFGPMEDGAATAASVAAALAVDG